MAALEKSLAEAGAGRKQAAPRKKEKAEARDGELADLSREELYERAQEEDVPGRSSMSKGERIDALARCASADQLLGDLPEALGFRRVERVARDAAAAGL